MNKFERSFMGYDIDQVKSFLNEVIENYDSLLKKLKERDILIEELKKNTNTVYKYESAEVLEVAKKKADSIIEEANKEREEILKEKEIIKNNIITYKRKLADILDSQRDLIDSIDKTNF